MIKFSITIIVFVMMISSTSLSFAETLSISTNNKVFSPGEPFLVYGQALPKEDLIIRLFAPDETISKFEQVSTNDEGSFNLVLLTWPESSTVFPYGTYTVEVISTTQNGISKKVEVKFSSTSELVDVPVERHLSTLVFVPETAAVNSTFRVFVQTTSDGMLIGGDPAKLLETSHVHLPSGKVESLVSSFKELHQGLYYADYTPQLEGTYIFHIVTFSQGSISHGSAATTVLKQDIAGISNEILKLNTILSETSGDLSKLKAEIQGFGTTLDSASSKIDSSVTSITSSVSNIEEASVQLNSLFFPIVASIGIIVALQIAILARRR